MNREIISSWVSYSMRQVMNNENIRNIILANFIQGSPNIVFGKTFEAKYKLSDLRIYLEQISTDGKIHLFTVANLPDKLSGETHFQTFILLNASKTIYAIDPARTKKGEGIYGAYAGEYVLQFFNTKKYITEWNPVSYACQTCKEDVFCQSWSLFLQIKMFLMLESGSKLPQVCIPRGLGNRYQLLLDFFKNIVLIPEVATELKSRFKYDMKNIAIDHLSKTEVDTIVKQVDPAAFLLTMDNEEMKN